jgi:hypothetical protein
MPARHDPRARPDPRARRGPPGRGEGAAAGRQQRPPQSQITPTDETTVATVSSELQPRRFGHDPTSCTTCQIVVAMEKRRSAQELVALRNRQRIIDLRGDQ